MKPASEVSNYLNMNSEHSRSASNLSEPHQARFAYLLFIASVPVLFLYYIHLVVFLPVQEPLYLHVLIICQPLICILLAFLMLYWKPQWKSYVSIVMIISCAVSFRVVDTTSGKIGDFW